MSKEQLEGSKERAADRGRDQLFGDNLPDNALNSMQTVDAVVRSFVTKVIDVRVRYNTDQITETQARQEVDALAQQYGDVFMGKSQDYAALPWNSPAQLGEYLVGVMEGDATPETSARDFFLYIASQLLQTMVEFEHEKIDDEVMKFRLDTLLEDAAHALLGIPNMEMPEDDS